MHGMFRVPWRTCAIQRSIRLSAIEKRKVNLKKCTHYKYPKRNRGLWTVYVCWSEKKLKKLNIELNHTGISWQLKFSLLPVTNRRLWTSNVVFFIVLGLILSGNIFYMWQLYDQWFLLPNYRIIQRSFGSALRSNHYIIVFLKW